MNHVLAIARKELRAYFWSPVAFIFLGTFLAVTLFTFFWIETFFTRNIADIRPLFTWLPVLLVFLVGALSMRLWSEEQKLGTLEVLFTLPVETHKLVLGKFLGALALVALALALTLGVPISVSFMGDLDWGPVVGGYLAALLLAGAYLAIGLTVSSLTDNQIIALIGTVLACSFLYVLGTDAVTGLVGNRGAEFLSALGVGSRFESIGRGVLDVRDLVYYGTLIVFFLVLNTAVLESKRWSDGPRSTPLRTSAKTLVGLALVNLLVLNVWLAMAPRIRLDLTARGEYSISKTTREMVRGLSAPLLIRGYFSQKTHPLLAPLVPRIRDMIQEYAAISGGEVRVEFVDPRDDKELEKEANEVYGIKSFPFRVADRYEAGVVNSYFSLLIKYGDQHQVLGFDDLIEVQPGNNGVDVRLRNLEYDLTKTIKKVAYSFQTLEQMFAELKAPIQMSVFVTPKTLPQNFKEAPERIEKTLKELTEVSKGKFSYTVEDPDSKPGLREELLRKYGFRPMAVSLLSQESFYLHLLLKNGDRYEQIFPSETLSEADLKNEITAAVKRGAPGFLKTIGLVKAKTAAPQNPMMPHQPPQEQDVTRMLSEQLSQNYTLKTLELTDGRVPGDVDVLLVVAPKALTDKQTFAVDQYLMRGGSVIVLGGRYEMNTSAGPTDGIKLDKIETGLEGALASYGITVQDKLVLDPQNEPFPIPVVRDLGGLKVRDIQLVRYPFFVDVRSSGMSRDTPVTSGLAGVTLQWASPIVLSEAPAASPKDGEDAPKREVQTLLRSTDKSWTQVSTDVQPDFERYGELGFAIEGERKAQPIAVSVRGNFDSAFKDKPNPVWADAGDGDKTGRTLKRSPDTARLVVVASSSFVNDMVLSLSRQVNGERFTTNLQFVQNLVDWCTADVDLLSIRSRGTFARTLLPMDAGTRQLWEFGNYGLVVVLLGAIVVMTYGRRRRQPPIDLDPSTKHARTPRLTETEARS